MKILAMVLAGGNGTRLHPLTMDDAKPALIFSCGYRIIDFVLGNLVNSRVLPIYVLAQYKPRSLVEHVQTAWATWSAGSDPAIRIVLPEETGTPAPYRGTADAIHRNIHLIERHKPDLVAVFAADHVYRMDIRQMARFHRERGAEVTIAAVRVPIVQASAFGIMATGPEGELYEFQEKPDAPAALPTDPRHAYASMGNYLFEPHALTELLEEASRHATPDFGHHIMPLLPRRGRAWAYDFAKNRIPGLQPHEERGYWRDIGTIEAFRAAQCDASGPLPRFDLFNSAWPVRPDAHRSPRPAPEARARTALAGLVRYRQFDRARTRAALPGPV
jgi:glucose-1-phosphate adenylyltransferase